MEKILAPSNCPSCGEFLEWNNHILFCRNTDCGSQSQKKIEYFAKTLKIKGLGPAAITKLGLGSVVDIYTLTENDIAKSLNSERLAEKLYAEIENSRGAPLNTLLPALSIRLIGRTATDKLSVVCKALSEINAEVCAQAGLGPAATDSLLSFIEEELDLLLNLPHTMEFDIPKPKKEVTGVVCISGKLTSFKTKAEAAQELQKYGYTVKSSVTKDVTILVNESGIESTKTQKARKDGITIVENLLDFLGETNGIA